jgi:hypothetical protein
MTLITAPTQKPNPGHQAVSALAIEYITRDLFKGKTLEAACRSFAKKFNGESNLFLGTVNHSAEELVQAVLADKAALAIDNSKRMRPGCAAFAFEGTAAQFNLNKQQFAREICRQLAALFPEQPENDGSEDGAIALMNATRDLAPVQHETAVDSLQDLQEEDEFAAAEQPRA